MFNSSAAYPSRASITISMLDTSPCDSLSAKLSTILGTAEIRAIVDATSYSSYLADWTLSVGYVISIAGFAVLFIDMMTRTVLSHLGQ